MWLRFKGNKFFVRLVFILLLLISAQLAYAAVSKPIDLIRNGTERALRILRESQSGQAPSLRQRRDEILNIVAEYFNFEEMAKRALGRPWKEHSPEKQQEFAKLFKRLLYDTYISRIESYTGSNEQVFYDSETVDDDYAVVKTHILYQGNDNVTINYRLHLDGKSGKYMTW